MNIMANVNKVKQEIVNASCTTVRKNSTDVTIIGVTKYVDNIVAQQLLASGITNLGENRADMFLDKYNEIGKKPVWHFIGTLQTRKVRDVINKIDYLHSLDRLSLAEEINKRADKTVKCFVQVNVSEENSKHGLAQDSVIDFIKQISSYEKIAVVGLMTMAPDTVDEFVIRSCFSRLKQLQKEVQSYCPTCTELSMGMTNDYKIAIEEGATFIRLGRCLVRTMDK